jgi:hypothetical protein
MDEELHPALGDVTGRLGTDLPVLVGVRQEAEIGETRRKVLEHLLDSVEAGPQSVSQIISALGTLSRNTVESAIRRNLEAELIERVGPGLYILAKPKPAKPSLPLTPPPPADEAALFDALERWAVDPASWDVAALGPPPNDPASKISLDIRTRFLDRVRKREARRRDAEAAAARQAAVDRELHSRLLAATYGNHSPELAAGGDVSAIRAALQIVDLDSVLHSIRMKTDKRIFPGNEPATSWSERRLLEKIASDYCNFTVVPSLIAGWSNAEKAPAKPADASTTAQSSVRPFLGKFGPDREG